MEKLSYALGMIIGQNLKNMGVADLHNERFAKAPRHDFDVHWPLENDDDLAVFFTWREHSSSVKISDSTV